MIFKRRNLVPNSAKSLLNFAWVILISSLIMTYFNWPSVHKSLLFFKLIFAAVMCGVINGIIFFTGYCKISGDAQHRELEVCNYLKPDSMPPNGKDHVYLQWHYTKGLFCPLRFEHYDWSAIEKQWKPVNFSYGSGKSMEIPDNGFRIGDVRNKNTEFEIELYSIHFY